MTDVQQKQVSFNTIHYSMTKPIKNCYTSKYTDIDIIM